MAFTTHNFSDGIFCVHGNVASVKMHADDGSKLR